MITYKPTFGLIVLLFSITLSMGQDRITGRHFATRSEVIAKHGMAATSQPLATQVALDILKSGGNAIDAAIAANATLGLMEPTGCGIGGDLFAIVWEAKTKKLHGLNASGRSPKGLELSYFQENDLSSIPYRGALSISIPGCVDGWFELHDKLGKLPMEEILAPAISYAREGFPVSELIAHYIQLHAKGGMADLPFFRETYMPNGQAPLKGDLFQNPNLANTLEKIAQGGREAFYKGPMAEEMAKYIQEAGGFISKEDFEQHRSEWIDPVSTTYRGYEVWELPPNGQGIAALQMLNLLEPFDLTSMGFNSADYVHTLVEAKKIAYEDRAKYYADMDFNDVPVDWLISKEYAQERLPLLDPTRAAARYDAGKLKEGDTIYLTVADEEGNMVSFIQSNFAGMGSGVIPGDMGFMFQNRGALFTLEQGHFNVYEPGKRPFHTIIPAFVSKDGEPYMSFGVMGGDMQPQGHVQILVNMIDFGMNLQEAGDAPRIRHSGSSSPTGNIMKDGGVIYMETGFDYHVMRKLRQMGHTIEFNPGAYGGYQAIRFDKGQGVYYGASEARKDGQAAGY